jgi:hypothetical protein
MISEDARSAKKPRPHLGAKIPHEIYSQFLRLKEGTGKTESEIVNEAIAAYLGVKTEATVPDLVTQLRNDVDELKQEVAVVMEKFRRLAIR